MDKGTWKNWYNTILSMSCAPAKSGTLDCIIVQILTSEVHLLKVVHWTSVGKTGTIDYCTHSNKSGAHAKSGTLDVYIENMVQLTSVRGKYGTITGNTGTMQ